MKIGIRDAKARLHRLVDAAIRGEKVILTRAGQPCVQLLPMQQAGQLPDRQPGTAKGKAVLMSAFFDTLPGDELRAWNGG
jgi:prevent-host-death family protein